VHMGLGGSKGDSEPLSETIFVHWFLGSVYWL
jgi:hypothetical protein